MKHRINRVLLVALLAAGSASIVCACALTSKAELVEIRYFSPERVPKGNQRANPKMSLQPELRLGRVSSGPSLRERIAYRDAAYELGYHEALRWSERPETYVRRQLERSLFEAHDLLRVVSGLAPTLDVEVLAFDDVHLATGRTARIQLTMLLYSGERVLFEDTFTTDRLVADESERIEDLVEAMSTALEAASAQVTRRVLEALASAGGPWRCPIVTGVPNLTIQSAK